MITFIANSLDTKHCNLSRCTDLLDRITRLQHLAHAKHGKHARFVYKMGDIKNMYTELRHEVIIEALDWALDTFRRKTRRSMLSAAKYGRKGVYVGHTTLDSEIKLSLAEIRKIVLFAVRCRVLRELHRVAVYAINDRDGCIADRAVQSVVSVLLCGISAPIRHDRPCQILEREDRLPVISAELHDVVWDLGAPLRD